MFGVANGSSRARSATIVGSTLVVDEGPVCDGPLFKDGKRLRKRCFAHRFASAGIGAISTSGGRNGLLFV